MKISSRVDYALSCALRIADRFETKKPVPISYISEKERIEPDYAEQLLIKMKEAGILKSVRGSAGGYLLSRSPARITAKDILKAIEKDMIELVCSRKKGRRRNCAHLRDCKVKRLWIDLGEKIGLFLDKYTLKELLALRRRERNWAA